MFVISGVHGMTRELTRTPKHRCVGNRIRLDQTQYCKNIKSDVDLITVFKNVISTHADEVAKT